MAQIAGQDNFCWWHGVVEDVADPLKLGRCRVRVFGYHSEDLVELPVADLPWAYPMQPITSAALSGIGTSPTGLLVGSHVFGFFRDGEEAQDPVMIGSFGGIPLDSPKKPQGFYDPTGKYPATYSGVYPIGVSVVGEADTNKLATNGTTDSMKDTVVAFKLTTKMKDIESTPGIKAAKTTWSEPGTPFAAQYPKNQVRFTESGHIEEFDDTPGAERIHQYHTSGTFTEVGNGWKGDTDGTRVQRIVGNDYEICYGNKKIFVGGSGGVNVVIRGAANITILGSGSNVEIYGDVSVMARKNVSLQCDGNLKASAKQMEFFSEGDIGFSGKTISFLTEVGVMVITGDGKIAMNSGEPVIRPKAVKLQ